MLTDSQQASEISKEAAEKINAIGNDFLIIVVSVIVLALILVAVQVRVRQKRRGSVFNPTRMQRAPQQKYEGYTETHARITDIQEQTYTVYPYESKPSNYEYIPMSGWDAKNETPWYERRRSRGIENNLFERMRRERNNELNEMRNRRLAAGPQKEAEPIRKTRYRVLYDFDTLDGRTFTGETIIFRKTDEYEVGKYIDVKYKPSNPMANFLSSRPPF